MAMQAGGWPRVEVRWSGRGRGADGRARSMSVVVPGTGLLRGSRRLGLDPDLDLTDASVPGWCSQPRVQRAATRFPWAVAVGVGGGDVVPHQAGRRSEDGKSEFKTGLKRWLTCPSSWRW